MKTASVRKIFRLLLPAALVPALLAAGYLALALRGLPEVAFLADPGAKVALTVTDWEGNLQPFEVGPGNPDWTPLTAVSPHLRSAVRAGEDFSFYAHNGVDWFEVRASFIRNLKERRFARGASTITQQVAKNLFLTRDKTIRRKVRELFLARRLEKELSKDRIFELYMNLVEMGDGVYGVGAGARHYFGKTPADLTVRESALLAAVLPGPRHYDPATHPERVAARVEHILAVMLKGRMITGDQYRLALAGDRLAPGEEHAPGAAWALDWDFQEQDGRPLPPGGNAGGSRGAASPRVAQPPIVEVPVPMPDTVSGIQE